MVRIHTYFFGTQHISHQFFYELASEIMNATEYGFLLFAYLLSTGGESLSEYFWLETREGAF